MATCVVKAHHTIALYLSPLVSQFYAINVCFALVSTVYYAVYLLQPHWALVVVYMCMCVCVCVCVCVCESV